MKAIDTLVEDIYTVVKERGGWDTTVNDYFKESIGATAMARFGELKEEHKGGTLRMSSIGQPCERKLWYSVNNDGDGEELRAPSLIKFAYGDILEDLILSLAVAAGHKVEGRQDTLEIKGIKGHRDAVIDGVTIDVKSASPYSFKKFKDHKLIEDDPFGYMWQLTSYVHAAKDDPKVEDKDGGAFLAIDKVNGTLALDYYDLKKEGYLDKVEELYTKRIDSSSNSTPPKRTFDPVPEGKSGNMKLGINCSYCEFKYLCHPKVRTFIYSNGPTYLTTVKRVPKVTEVT